VARFDSIGQPLEVLRADRRFLVAPQADEPDARQRHELQQCGQHRQAGPQDRHDHHVACDTAPLGHAERRHHLHRPLRQRRQRRGAEHETDSIGQHPELLGSRGDVAQLREAVVHDGMLDEVKHEDYCNANLLIW
jgi:hypothetical protein